MAGGTDVRKIILKAKHLLDNKHFIEAQDAGLYTLRFIFMATLSELRL